MISRSISVRVELALVLEQVELLRARLGIDHSDVARLPSGTRRSSGRRLDCDHVVVDEVALADGPLVLVAVDDVLEVRRRVSRRRRGQADLDRVEVVERVAPDRQLRLMCIRGGTRRR